MAFHETTTIAHPAAEVRAALLDELFHRHITEQMGGEVAAFEGLVGCHGGLGGWQDRAMLVWPSDLPHPPERLVGADAVHRQLVSWLEHLGHRADLPAARPRPYDAGGSAGS